MKKVAIVQSNYVPWKGYFDMIAAVDEFILYDDMQYTRRDWRNRNRIKSPNGLKWMTVPVKVKGRYYQTIRETEIDNMTWARQHWKTLELNYSRADHFEEVASVLEPLYVARQYIRLNELNRAFIETICSYMGIATKIRDSSDYILRDGKSERLADLCVQAEGSEYLSGPAAKGYLDEDVFACRGISVRWMDYTGYPEYRQLWGEFVHEVSILDLLFNCGRKASHYMKYISR